MPTTDETEIRAIIADQLAALRDRDPERMHAAYAPTWCSTRWPRRCSTSASTSSSVAAG